MNSAVLKHQIRLHLIVVIFGFTGILGKLIEIPAQLIVIYRMFIASAALFLFLKFTGRSFERDRKNWTKWLLTGVIVGLHWYFFFESIKQSTVSIALVSLSSTALFTSFLEPLILRKKISWYELVFSVMIIVGMAIVLRFEFQFYLGILYGILSAILASLFTVINSRYVSAGFRPTEVSFFELLGGAVFMLAVVSALDGQNLSILPSFSDWAYLILLAVVATALAFVVSIDVMKKLSPFTVSLTINLEPLYGIILAVIIFGQEEYMSSGFYAGFTVILSTILLNAYLKKKQRTKESTTQ